MNFKRLFIGANPEETAFLKIFWLKNILLAGIFASLLLSEKLWLTVRSYPIVPIVPGLPSFPYPLDHVVFFAILAAIACGIFWPKPRLFLIIAALGLGILGLMDQTRWQPEFYEYFFLLIALCLFSWNRNDAKGRNALVLTCQAIIIFVYIWSGLQKVNPSFINIVFPFILHPLSKFFPGEVMTSFLAFAGIAPFAETAAGIGLLLRRFRNLAVMFAILMHVFILYAIGPFGNNWNNIIWPWQILMIFFVWLLFWNNENEAKSILNFKSRGEKNRTTDGVYIFRFIVLILFGIMPLFSFFGLWDENLSFALYTGNTPNAVFYIDNSLLYNLSTETQEYAVPDGPNSGSISTVFWSLAELDVPAYPQERVYVGMLQKLCTESGFKNNAAANITLVIHWGQSVIGAMRAPTTYACR